MTHLKKGDHAPDFKGINQDGEEITLSQFTGNKVVLYFYPKDMTPGCTAQACNLTNNYDAFISKGIQVIGISSDSAQQHQKFAEKYKLPFTLIADTEKEIINTYGVWGEKNNFGKKYEGIYRETFLIDANGNIEEIITKVKTKTHAEQIFALWNK